LSFCHASTSTEQHRRAPPTRASQRLTTRHKAKKSHGRNYHPVQRKSDGCPTFATAYVGRKKRGEAPPKLLDLSLPRIDRCPTSRSLFARCGIPRTSTNFANAAKKPPKVASACHLSKKARYGAPDTLPLASHLPSLGVLPAHINRVVQMRQQPFSSLQKSQTKKIIINKRG